MCEGRKALFSNTTIIPFIRDSRVTLQIFRIKRKNIYTKIEISLPFVLCLYKIDS